MNKHFLNKKTFTICVITFFCLLPLAVIYKWFNNGTIIYFWDINFPLDPRLGISHFFYIWKENIFPGFFDTGWSWLPYISVLVVFYQLFHSLVVVQGLLYWLLLVISLISFYFLIEYLLKLLQLRQGWMLRYIEVLGAILYAFNTYVYYYSFRIFNPQEFIIAFLPLHFLALLHLYPIETVKPEIDKKSWIIWLVVFFLSLLCMTSGLSTLIYYIEYLGLIGFYLLYQCVYRKEWSMRAIVERCLFLFTIIIYNFWWSFPIYLGLKDVYQKAAQIGTVIYFVLNSQLSNLLNAMRLIGLPPMQTPLFSWEGLYLHNLLFTFPLFIFPLFIILLAFRLPKISGRGTILFLFTVFSVLLFIVKEANPPFSFILQFAFNHIPFFGVFRDAYQKAGLYYTFAYFLLFSLATGVIYQGLAGYRKYIAGAIVLFTLIAGVVMTAPFFIFQNIPFLTDTSHSSPLTYSAKTKIPDEYYSLKTFLEPNCAKSAVLVIPRTSILSSAYWTKTKYSYVGQDILSNLIGCNFISTQVLDSAIDAYYSVPYLALQKDNFSSFKDFLFQSGIQIVVVRHDYFSNGYTDFTPVDVPIASQNIQKDKDFARIYSNNLFDVYRYKSIPDSQYGISFPEVSVFTNVDFNSGQAIQTFFTLLPSQRTFVNSAPDDINAQQEKIVFANCIGCEYLPGSGELDQKATASTQENLLSQTIKNLLHKQKTINTVDERLATMESSFQVWMQSESPKDGKIYKKNISLTLSKYKQSLTGDFFTDDYLTIKIKNYLVNEYNSLLQNLENSQTLSDEDNISDLLQSTIANVENNMWETDFASQLLRFRLDIPQTEAYVCRTDNKNQAITPDTITIDDKVIAGTNVLLSKGSHKVEIKYLAQNIFPQTSLLLSGDKVIGKKIALHGFTPGNYYSIMMQTATTSAKDLKVFILNQDLSLRDAAKFVTKKDQKFLYSSAVSAQSFTDGITNYFYSSNNSTDSYYLYVIGTFRSDRHQLLFTQFAITPIPTKDTVLVFCKDTAQFTASSIKFTVQKKNPTTYMLSLDKNNSIQNRIVIFNQSFHPLWTAYSFINGKKHIYKHLLHAGYANAWEIDAVGDGKIYITFSPQVETEIVGFGSSILFLILFAILLFLKEKKIK